MDPLIANQIEESNHNVIIPMAIVNQEFRVRQTIKAAKVPANRRWFPKERSSCPVGQSSSGRIKAAKTEGGTYRRQLRKNSDIRSYGTRAIKERRVA